MAGVSVVVGLNELHVANQTQRRVYGHGGFDTGYLEALDVRLVERGLMSRLSGMGAGLLWAATLDVLLHLINVKAAVLQTASPERVKPQYAPAQ
jgi:hypothetical protein